MCLIKGCAYYMVSTPTFVIISTYSFHLSDWVMATVAGDEDDAVLLWHVQHHLRPSYLQESVEQHRCKTMTWYYSLAGFKVAPGHHGARWPPTVKQWNVTGHNRAVCIWRTECCIVCGKLQRGTHLSDRWCYPSDSNEMCLHNVDTRIAKTQSVYIKLFW